jgi:hypothetical protein
MVDLTALGIPSLGSVETRTFFASSPLMPKCCNQTAHLASISDATENERLRAMIPTNDTAYVLIGVNNYDNPPNYVWDGTAEAVSYTNWCGCGEAQQPIETSNVCAAMDKDGKWNELVCDLSQGPTLLVEYDCEPSVP